jgi:hypothetical protein
LVLASRSGFSKRAVGPANRTGIELLTYTDVSQSTVESAVALTADLWAMIYSLKTTRVIATVEATAELAEERVAVSADTDCFDEAGAGGVTMLQLVGSYLNDEQVSELLRREGNETHTHLKMEVNNPVMPARDRSSALFLQMLEPRILRRVVMLDIVAECRIRRARFSMAHANLGTVRVAWGATVFDGRNAMLVAVRGQEASESVTLHLGEPSETTRD